MIDVQAGRTVVTVIEIVSPSNKRGGQARELYEKKQSEVEASPASMVEIDLIRHPRGVTLAWKHHPARALQEPYHVSVRRGWRRNALEIYPLSLRNRLPGIRLPLRRTDSDLGLDLQRLIDDTYARGRCDELIDYSRLPEPPLDADDTKWAGGLIDVWGAAAEGM
jgi:hypothetical protein